MKRLLLAALILAGIAARLQADSAPLVSLHAIKQLSNAEAAKGVPVAFEATVTYFRGYQHELFVQDGQDAIYVQATTSAALVPGDRVLVKGTTQASFRPIVVSSDITQLHHGDLPKPVPATFDELIQAQFDSMLVTIRGTIRSADTDQSAGVNGRSCTLRVLTDGGYIDAYLDNTDASALPGLLDAQAEITAVAGGRFDGKMQMTGILLHIEALNNIRVLKPATVSPWSLPVTPMSEIMKSYRVQNLTGRVRVHGTITYYEPGSAVVLQNGSSSLWIRTHSYAPMRIGDLADATGFPEVNDGFLELTGSEIQDNHIAAPIAPRQLSVENLNVSKPIFDLVSVGGKVLSKVRLATQEEYVLASGDYVFSATYKTSGSNRPVADIPLGSTIQVSGICVLESSDPYIGNVPFNILLRSPDDIAVVEKPSWLTPNRLIILVGLLLIALLAVGMREWLVERKVRRQIGVLAYVEQRRGHILEDINSSRPLSEILERITELVSVKLNGAACWCQITGGARLGNPPPDLADTSLRVEEQPIASRSGPALGSIFAAFDSYTKVCAAETEALQMGAGLATLAIETSRLYSDLVHRSEFDLLTDIQNRFSLERHLEHLIQVARETAGVFGLLFIDLNKFKQVNDVYGHRAGDLYLQQVATRMKRQLRPGDMLARLGGDEFAVLVPNVRGRSDVDEIALRLEACFDKPFPGEGYVIHGSASIGIALYPEDGTTKDSLLSMADSAMYVIKQSHPRRKKGSTANAPDHELAPEDRS
ncbi:MAG TPA: GGDEF domain-containing protein [Terracidiphilus sp.]|nr:GGDEF domain-containing protein [Terracidiphilus sp.]